MGAVLCGVLGRAGSQRVAVEHGVGVCGAAGALCSVCWVIPGEQLGRGEGTGVNWWGRTGAAGQVGGRQVPLSPGLCALHGLGKRELRILTRRLLPETMGAAWVASEGQLCS